MPVNNCRRLRDDAYMNPNNYDLLFDSSEIPVNVQTENSVSLEKRLQKLMPLGKIIHVDSASASAVTNNGISVLSQLNLRKPNGELIKRVDFI